MSHCFRKFKKDTFSSVSFSVSFSPRALALILLCAGFGGAPASAASKTPTTKPRATVARLKVDPKTPSPVLPPKVAVVPGSRTLIATANGRLTPVFRTYQDKKPFVTLDGKKRYSNKSIFTVLGKQGKYLIVNLPVRPNGAIGFVQANAMNLTETDTLITVSLTTHELVAYRGTEEVLRTSAAVGQTEFPTPKGTFYTLEVAKLKNPQGAFGPYALGLSGFSNVLTEFGRGDGQLAIHGTDHPELLGQNVSHGCIRVSNEAITRLVQEFPLGAPVVISD
jgi:lipoprotein-anchoring transpeptidase ErfK/SrfK